MEQDPQGVRRRLARLIMRAWEDAEFKAELIKHPKEVMKKNEITFPEGFEVRVLENTDRIMHIVIPSKPQADRAITEEIVTRIIPGWD